MDSHALNSLLEYRRKLEKLSAIDSNPSDHFEDAFDCLTALKSFPITSDLITQSGLGNVVASMRDKFLNLERGEQIIDLTQRILVEWKNIKRSAKSGHQSKGHESVKQHEEPANERKKQLLKESANATFVTDLESLKQQHVDSIDLVNLEKRKSFLSQARKGIVNIFVNIFKGSIGTSRADKIALDIESEINALHNHESSQKDYIAKAKTLSVNIKMNKVTVTVLSIYPNLAFLTNRI